MLTHATILLSPILGGILDPESWFSMLQALFQIFLSLTLLVLWIGGILGTLFLIHFLLTLPMRRAERARLFLDLVGDALQRGQTVEQMMVSLAQSRDRTVGVRFHQVAVEIEGGLRFRDALEKVPGFLPPQILAMLRAGERMGDVGKVLPACREILRERPVSVRGAMHYMLLVVFFFSPVFCGMFALTAIFVIPRFKDVAGGMGIEVWPLARFVFANAFWLVGLEVVVSLFLGFLTVLYLGGPRLARWFPLADWMAWRIPWKRKRLQRTFSAMLAVLLDNGVPETEALQLAGDSTANEICRARVRRVIAEVQRGTKLDEAVRAFDDSGEFHWRLANASPRSGAGGGFLGALRGWHETLDARAFQQEEATAHVVTSGIVILNGLLVGLVATAMYGLLVVFLKHMLASE